jgi:OFA family oxalate/formate antiporter-like MFS transporter
MGLAGTYQFFWSSIRGPVGNRFAVSETGLGTVFSIFIIFQTVSQFPAGRLRDRHGPRTPLLFAAVFLGAGYAGVALAPNLPLVVLAYSAGGIGAGTAYTVAVNTPVKWFGKRRGLATGVVTTASSGFSFFLIPLLRRGIAVNFRSTLLIAGVLAGGVALGTVAVLRDPADDPTADPKARGGTRADTGERGGRSADDGGVDRTSWRSVVGTHQFWLLYASFVLANGIGLMIIGSIVEFSRALGLSAGIATASASVVALADAAGIGVGGYLGDRFGYVRTVVCVLVLCGLSLSMAIASGTAGAQVVFVVTIGAAAFFRGPVFSIFPVLIADYYGTERSSENYALLYSGKLWGGLFGGVVTGALVTAVGWRATFALGAVAVAAGGLVLLTLRPPRLSATTAE